MHDYGYKVCYNHHGKNKLKIHLITNTYHSAEWSVRWYESHSPLDRKTLIPLDRVTWIIIPN